jgi:serine/threonine protein phosphatase PrpC
MGRNVFLNVASRSVPGSQHPFEDRTLVDEGKGLFAVADGVTRSSHGSGALAAELSIRLLKKNYGGDLVEAVTKTHKEVVKRRAEDWEIGETTLTAVAAEDDDLQAANVGDSPALLIRGGEIQSLYHEDKTLTGSISQTMGYPDEIAVNSSRTRLQGGDVVIVASDGVGHVLRPPIIYQLLGKPRVNEVADAIIATAKSKPTGYDDDKSVIVINFAGQTTV